MTGTTETSESTTAPADLRGGTMQVPRSRGALSGIALIVLGAWGALIPFIGPYFNVSYLPDTAWHWTDARGWLEVLPGAVAFVGGLLSLTSSNRAVISLGAWLGVAAGAWFVIGRDVAQWFDIGSPGRPAGTSDAIHATESLVMFSALGAVILFFAATAVGRLSVRAVRDVRVAQRRAARVAKRDQAVRDSAYEQGHRDGLAAAREEQRTNQTSAPAQHYPAAPPAPETTTGQHAAPPAEYREPVIERDTRAPR